MKKSVILGAVTMALVSAMQPASATAQDTSSNDRSDDPKGVSDQEIIVTATKRAERLIDVPASISAITADDYERLNARQLEDVQKLVPNLSVAQGQGVQSTRYTIRGVGSVSTRAALQTSVAVFIDDIYQASPVQSNIDLVDIARVEVLRGPQGTLFGRNSMGGAIRIVTRVPTNDFSGSAELLYGNYDYLNARGNIGGALVNDTLYASIGVSHIEGGGYVYNPNTDDAGPSSNRDAARLSLRLAPAGSRGTLTITGHYAKSADITAIASANPFQFRQLGSTNQTLNSENYGVSAHAEVDFDNVRLTAISSFDSSKFRTGGDGDGAPQFFFTNAERRSQRTMSQEIRLTSTNDGPLKWIVGGYYYYERYFRQAGETINLAAIAPPSITLPGGPTFPVRFFPSASPTIRDQLRVETNSFSLFGELSYDIGAVTLSIGGRYTWDNQDGTINQPDNIGFGFGPLPPTLIVSQLQSTQALRSKNFSPRAVVTYNLSDDANLYLSYSRGFKGGGFNTGLDPSSLQFLRVTPERLTNYEAGAKFLFGDRRYSLNMAGFYMDYNNIQVVQEINSALRLTGLVNAAKARIYGFELEGSGRLSDVVSLSFGLGYTNAKFTDYPACIAARRGPTGAIISPAVACDGRQLQFTPDWTANGQISIRQPLNERLTLVANSTVRFTDDRFTEVDNRAASKLSGYTTVDANLGLEFGNFSIGLWARNLLNEKYLTIYQNSPFFGNIYLPGSPRTYGVRAGISF
ncbi:MAG: TonB-dependent receptor [Sphingomonadaceae bacterium]|nr:TonB-dependent receptor [Sphingomonadaceae bacterium]